MAINQRVSVSWSQSFPRPEFRPFPLSPSCQSTREETLPAVDRLLPPSGEGRKEGRKEEPKEHGGATERSRGQRQRKQGIRCSIACRTGDSFSGLEGDRLHDPSPALDRMILGTTPGKGKLPDEQKTTQPPHLAQDCAVSHLHQNFGTLQTQLQKSLERLEIWISEGKIKGLCFATRMRSSLCLFTELKPEMGTSRIARKELR
ncbi:hypothetical protein ZWY2020_017402 [Hordeum vulgare]|nr:hypothetical protein ZWY2020_017402 [Hordeum vulgare]